MMAFPHFHFRSMDAAISLQAVLTGRAQPFAHTRSAIDKAPVAGKVRIDALGLVGDEQGDRVAHGGVDKAVHHYAFEHYAGWRDELAASGALLEAPGAFGENFSTLGITEADVCIGDVYEVGDAVLQVSQARQPCWKLDVRFGARGMARKVQRSGRTGWYYRVLHAGEAAAGDTLRLIERPHPDWTLERLLRIFYVDMLDYDALREIAAIEVLAPNWRKLAARRIEARCVESWARRLGETPAD